VLARYFTCDVLPGRPTAPTISAGTEKSSWASLIRKGSARSPTLRASPRAGLEASDRRAAGPRESLGGDWTADHQSAVSRIMTPRHQGIVDDARNRGDCAAFPGASRPIDWEALGKYSIWLTGAAMRAPFGNNFLTLRLLSALWWT